MSDLAPARPNASALDFGLRRQVPVIYQTETSECGLACLAMIASALGRKTSLAELRLRFPASLRGMTLLQLSSIGQELGLLFRAVRLELAEMAELQLPAILHWDLNHFVVLERVVGQKLTIIDPGSGRITMPLSAAEERFTGVAVEFSPSIDFARKRSDPPVKLRSVLGKVIGLRRALLQIFVLAVVMEVFSLTLPLFTQWIMDEAIAAGDRRLLTMLALGAILVGLSSAVVAVVRSWISLFVGTHFNLQWMANVMGHLLRLPVEFFERRHLGDIVSRFESVATIERTVTSSLVDVLLDGLLAVGTLIMMCFYSLQLAAIAVSAVIIYAAIRWVRYNAVRAAATGQLAKHAREQSYFLETIRGARAIKLFGRESERRAAWSNLWVEATNANLTLQKLHLTFGATWNVLSTIERIAVLWVGALVVMNGHLTIGMLFAFLAYKEQFSGRVSQLVDRLVELRMLSIQTERLADIVLAKPEEKGGGPSQELPDTASLQFEGVTFRYAKDDPAIVRSANLMIREGECIAITGASGAGKTTCLKLMLGILEPTAGTIRYGGVPIQHLGLRRYRSCLGVVMQDDQLFSGSLFDNISFLDPKPDRSWIETCARQAAIHHEISAMPMGYFTLVGDMGMVLSGGQKQRVLLARALYKRPRVLLLDEATSQLDLPNENQIVEALRTLDVTRIIIAHRPQTIALADRVVALQGGQFKEVSRMSESAEPATRQLRSA